MSITGRWRRAYWALFGVLCLGFVGLSSLSLSGFSDLAPRVTNADGQSPDGADAKQPSPAKSKADEKQLTLLCTISNVGYIEPCG